MKNNNGSQFRYGLRDGVPIGLGYLAISFTFSIVARGAGFDIWQAVVMSFINLTSADQFAVLDIIQVGAPLMGMAVIQPIINLRYCLMSCSLSQKLGPGIPSLHRFPMVYGVMGEMFGVSVYRPGMLSPFYDHGPICVAVPGWTLGTPLGAVSGDLLPARLLNALNVVLYGMSLVVVIPLAKSNHIFTGVTLTSMALSFLLTRTPTLDHISSSFKVIILTITIVGTAVVPFPAKEEPVNES